MLVASLLALPLLGVAYAQESNRTVVRNRFIVELAATVRVLQMTYFHTDAFSGLPRVLLPFGQVCPRSRECSDSFQLHLGHFRWLIVLDKQGRRFV